MASFISSAATISLIISTSRDTRGSKCSQNALNLVMEALDMGHWRFEHTKNKPSTMDPKKELSSLYKKSGR